MSVSPLEEDNSDARGDDTYHGVRGEESGGGTWERMMEPFDQDKEEEEEKEEKDKVDKSQEATKVKMVR